MQSRSECTHRINRYFNRRLPILFYDIPSISTKSYIKIMAGFILKKLNSSEETQKPVQVIFYILSGKNARFFVDFEIKDLELTIKDYKIPLYFLVIKIKTKKNMKRLNIYYLFIC